MFTKIEKYSENSQNMKKQGSLRELRALEWLLDLVLYSLQEKIYMTCFFLNKADENRAVESGPLLSRLLGWDETEKQVICYSSLDLLPSQMIPVTLGGGTKCKISN